MNAFVFRNKGLIDPRSISTFGISSKDSSNAIGFFGTGLKYAIAILLRHGCGVTIWSGADCFVFSTVRDKVRNDEFDVVTMNGDRLGFTTELGKTWELWQAFRELYCNCRDEHGTIESAADIRMVDPQSEETVVIVTDAKGEPFRDVWASRSQVILESPPLVRTESANIHRGRSDYLYYRGIRAFKLDKPSLYTYDIQAKQDLTEDRTLKHPWFAYGAVRQGLCLTTDRQVVRETVTASKESFEGGLDFSGYTPSAEWLEEVKGLMKAWDVRLNLTAREACRVWVMEQLHEEDNEPLSKQDERRLERAIGFVTALGHPVREYPIVVTSHLGESVLGRAEGGKIYVSRRVFMMGTKMLAGTLLEEYIHLKFSLYDETRSMQNFLIDAMMSLGERITGDTL